MNKIMLGVIIVLQVITISLIVICSDCYNDNSQEEVNEEVVVVEEKDIEEINEVIVNEDKIIRVDVKGAVKNPGVYEIASNSRINDVIEMAGGLKSNASTKYLNLSKKITDEMVINVYTNNQVKDMEIVPVVDDECVCPTEDITDCAGANVIISGSSNSESNDNTSNKVSLNNASKEELMTLSGVGEAKAEAIIEYRTKNNGFKTLEELMNVSGIGEAAYNKIKEYITL